MKLTFLKVLAVLAIFGGAARLTRQLDRVTADTGIRFSGPTSSQPIALSADDSLLIVANPDNNSITLFNPKSANARVVEVSTGTEPNSVALSPDGTRAYVANTVSGTVTVLGINAANSYATTVLATIPVGVEPYGLALTPTGRKLYVANSRSNTVSVIDTSTNQVVRTVANVGIEPRGIAITNSNTGDDTQETVYVTQFLSLPVDGKTDGADDAKAGHVTAISANSDAVIGDIVLNPMADAGFNAAGDALKRIAPPATPVATDFKFPIGAYPNQLNNIAIRGKFAFVPNTGAAPNGPVRFDVNTESLLHVLDLSAKADANKTINMHTAVAKQTGTPKRFITQPWAMAFKHTADEGYVISAASNIVVKVKVDATGAPTVQNDPADATRVLEIPTGKNPRGIVVDSADKTAYVMNYISRDVTVIDLSSGAEKVTATLASASLPAAGSAEDKILVGKELYHTSIGVFDPPTAGGAAITGRMSNNGWGSCGACHPSGLTDNVVWIFPSGPRRTIPQHVDFDHTAGANTPNTIRALNWTVERDEEEDFELNIRAVSGGLGLIVLADGITQDPNVANFTPLASGGRNQLKVRGINAWDAIKAYVQTIRAPISPALKNDPDVVAGRQIFIDSNCQSCHGGAQWSSSKVRYTPAPDPSLLLNTQLIGELRDVNTFDPTAFNEVRATGAAPLGANGISPGSLLSIFAFPQTFFHNGSANTLDAVMQNIPHRSAGTGGVDSLSNAGRRSQLIKFLLSIDASTAPIAPNAPSALSILSAAGYVNTSLAPDSAASGFGTALASQTLVGGSPLPVTLNGTTVSLLDAAGVLRLAQLYFVSPGQVNFAVPTATATGQATVTLTNNGGSLSTAKVAINNVAPGIFAVDASGVAAATAIRVTSSGAQSAVTVVNCDASGCRAVPIDIGADRIFVTFYGTGIRKRSALTAVKCTIGGVDVPVAFAGDQGQFPGLDQLNVEIPASLKGKGSVSVVFTVDGQAANPVIINLL